MLADFVGNIAFLGPANRSLNNMVCVTREAFGVMACYRILSRDRQFNDDVTALKNIGDLG